MSTPDTRHPQYDDATLQAAIDEAFRKSERLELSTLSTLTAEHEIQWKIEAPARLALARGLLARLPELKACTCGSPWQGGVIHRNDGPCYLPEPPPPVVDGKTPGQLLHEKFGNTTTEYPTLAEWYKNELEEAAFAVLAAFGEAGLEAAIARMEAVPWKELDKAWDASAYGGDGGVEGAFEAVRARLIAAAREGQPLPITTLAQDQVQATAEMQAAADAVLRKEMSQPAEIPWTEWHGGECPLKGEEVEEWELKYRLGSTVAFKSPPEMAFGWKHHDQQDDIIAYRVTKWREGFGPAAVDWKAKLEYWEEEARRYCENATFWRERAEKAEAELAAAKPYLQEPDLPDEAVDVQANRLRAKCEWLQGICSGYEKQIQQANKTLRDSLSTLRPIAEAGEVPAGCLRIYTTGGEYPQHTADADSTHYADIRLLPEAKAPEPIKGLEGLTKDRCIKLAKLGENHTIEAGIPDVCPHASPHVFCETCKVSPCPIGLPQPVPYWPAEPVKPQTTKSMIVPMPHIYEFQIDGKPVSRMIFPDVLSNNDMAGIKLTLANRAEVSVDRITHTFEWVNLEG